MQIHENEQKQLFQLSKTDPGELEPLNSDNTQLRKDSVYILMDSTLKKIFLWIGQTADVRSRFIASTAAQNLRNMQGLHYRIISINQGGETKEFIKSLLPAHIPDILEKIR